PGARLPGSRERHLRVRAHALGQDAVAGRDGGSARRLHRGVRHGHRPASPPPGVRFHRRGSADDPQGRAMRALALVLLPAIAGALAFALRSDKQRRALLVGASLAQSGLVLTCLAPGGEAGPGEWLGVDPLGRVFLAITSALFLASASYAVGYLR